MPSTLPNSYTSAEQLFKAAPEVGSHTKVTSAMLIEHIGNTEAVITARIAEVYDISSGSGVVGAPVLQSIATDLSLHSVFSGVTALAKGLQDEKHPLLARYQRATTLLDKIVEGRAPLVSGSGTIITARGDNDAQIITGSPVAPFIHEEIPWVEQPRLGAYNTRPGATVTGASPLGSTSTFAISALVAADVSLADQIAFSDEGSGAENKRTNVSSALSALGVVNNVGSLTAVNSIATGDIFALYSPTSGGLFSATFAKFPSGGGGGASDLDGLSDVTITAIASGEVLQQNGTLFVNRTFAEADIAHASSLAAYPLSSALAATTNGNGASLIGIEDSGALITATTVEGALAEIATNVAANIGSVVEDTTPQLGGQLDINGNAIGDGARELLTFTEDASAVNHINIENEATGSGPILSAAGDDTNIDLILAGKGSGVPKIGTNAILDAGDIGVSVQAHDADLDTWAALTPSANAQSLVTAADYAAMRALLDLEAGTDFYSISAADAAFQPLDSDLTAIAALSSADGNFIVGSPSGWVAESGATARASLGVDAAGTDNSTNVTIAAGRDYVTISGQELTLGQIDLTTDVTGDLPFSNLAQGGAYTILLNNSGSTADLAPTKISALTAGTFGSGDKLIIEESTGELRQIDYDDLPGAGGGLSNIVEDTTPQLGGMLDVNGQAIGDGTLELLKFSETVSAVNELTVANAATGNGPTLSATGDDTNIDLNLAAKGTGVVNAGGNRVLTTADEGTGNGLDADTVDGNEASALLDRANHTGTQAASTIGSGTLAHERGGLEADVSAYSGLIKISGGATSQITDNSSNWDTAFGWGNHASAGYQSQAAILDDIGAVSAPSGADEVLVSTGVGTFALESGATLRTSLGLGTGDSPTFTAVTIGSSTPFSDSAGTLTLQNVDALDATTEATIEGAIDTLANLTSIQGVTVTLADAGANAIFGWDDVAGAYENLTQGEALAVLGLSTSDTPQFTGIELGHVSDTTITRASAGQIAVEGVNVLMNGGALGTPSSATLTNATGLPISTGVSGLGTGVATVLATPTAANFNSALSDGTFLFADDADQTITGGANVTVLSQGTKSTGTYTLDYGARPMQYLVNGGAFTLAPDASEGTMVLQITNDASAGAITTSGWTQVTGDSFTTTNGDDFICYCTTHNNGTSDFSHLHVVAMQ